MKTRMGMAVSIALAFCCLTVPALAQQFDESKWGKNSAGTQLIVSELPRQHNGPATVLTHTLTGKGYPSGHTYSLWGWIPGQRPEKMIQGVAFNAAGVLICAPKSQNCKADPPDAPIKIQTTAVLGEPKRFAVISDDGQVGGFAEAVPFPIEASDKNCKLAVIRESPKAEMVLIRASGFVPYEMLKVTGHVGGQDSSHSPTVGPDGTWEALLGTKAPGQDSGTATINVVGQQCSVAISFKWGEGTTDEQ